MIRSEWIKEEITFQEIENVLKSFEIDFSTMKIWRDFKEKFQPGDKLHKFHSEINDVSDDEQEKGIVIVRDAAPIAFLSI